MLLRSPLPSCSGALTGLQGTCSQAAHGEPSPCPLPLALAVSSLALAVMKPRSSCRCPDGDNRSGAWFLCKQSGCSRAVGVQG